MFSSLVCRKNGGLVAAALVVSCGLAFSSLVVPAVAAPQQAQAIPDEAKTEAAAAQAAKAGNKSVRVLDKTDEITEVRANPDGSFTWTQHVRPVRVNRSGKWVDADVTLERRADGTVGPRATVVDVSMSGGGAGSGARPLVKIAANGTEAGLSWPSDLPEPVLSGPTATYPDVLPGVDLRITADVLGYQQVLVVKTPEAAKNPRLKKIMFGSFAKGGKVSVDKGRGAGRRSDVGSDKQADGLKVADQSGAPVFHGDASAMWDSSAESTPELRGTGLGAHTAAMGVEVTDKTLGVSPDQAFLSAPDTKYPVFIDPDYNCTSCGKAHHVVVQSAWPTALNFDRTDGALNDLKAGYVCEGSCFTSRTYLRMSTGSLSGKKINDAYLHLDTLHSYYCSGATPTQLFLAGWVDGSTNYGNQPGPIGGWGANPLSTGNTTKNSTHCPGNPGGMDLWAHSAIQSAADNGWGETAFLIKGSNESNNTSWRRFDLNPYMIVKYNSYPNVPSDMGIEGWGPNAWDALPCAQGANRPFIATKTPRLRARISDPDGGMLDGIFHLSTSGAPVQTWDGNATFRHNIPSGSFVEAAVPQGTIVEDGTYFWNAGVGDGQLDRWSGVCEMTVDTAPPGSPYVSSVEYPAGKDAGGIGKSGSFTFKPPPWLTDDIAYYLYSFTPQGDDPQTRVTPAVLNGQVTVSWTPMVSGPLKLSVRAVDRAGNRSTITTYPIDVADYQVGVSGKVAQWSFEDTLADTAEAKSLTYVGPPPPGGYYGDGQQGRAVLMDAVNSEYYQAKDSLTRTDAGFTVSAWAFLGADDTNYTVLSQDGTRASGFKLQYSDADDRWALSVTNADVDIPSTVYKALSASPPSLNTWTHLTGVYDAAAAKLRIYVGGVLSGEASMPITPWNATGPFVIGAAKVGGARSQHFTGSIDSVRVHSRALTAAEIAALPAGSATANPVAEYLFEDSNLGDNIEEGLWNTGANVNLAQTPGAPTYQAGYAGRGYHVASSTSPRPMTAGPLVSTTDSFSVGGWVKLDDKAGYYALFSQDGNRTSGFAVGYAPNYDRFIFGLPNEDSDAAQYQWAIGTSSPQIGVWTHIAAVHDTATHKISLYVNGIREAQIDITVAFNATGPFVVGAFKLAGSYASLWTGSIDEVNVYDGALTDAEVVNLVNAPVERVRYALDQTTGTTVVNGVNGGPPGAVFGSGLTWGQVNGRPAASFTGNFAGHSGVVQGAGPRAAWAFDNTTLDYSGNGRDLVHANNSGTTAATYEPARFGSGIKLNGVDQRVSRTTPVLTTTASYSVSAWAKLDRDNSWFTIVSQDGNRSTPFLLQYNEADDRWVFSTTDGDRDNPVVTSARSTLPPKVGMWTHLLGVYDAQAGKIRLYVNGFLEGEAAVSSVWNSTGGFAVGRLKWNGNNSDFFPGSLDEVRAYDRALTAADAYSLWNGATEISAPRDPALRIDQSFTMAAWVRPSAYDPYARQAISLGATGRFSSLMLGYRPEWKRWGLLTENGGTQNVGTIKWILSDNEAQTYAAGQDGWVHLAVVYDAPNKSARLYVNGIQQTTVPIDGTNFQKVNGAPPANYGGAGLTLAEPARDLLIGRTTWEGAATDPWLGAIRDVRVFTGVLPNACDNSPVCISQLAI
jgi:hypothetical protein